VRAAILSIGDELILGQTIDSNPVWLARELAARAITAVERRLVPDDRGAIAQAIRELAGRCDVVLTTGGLGPTPDDLTREALGDVLAPGRPLETDAAGISHLTAWFERTGRPAGPSNLRQAERPWNTRLLPNPGGTAPGIAGAVDDCLIFALPGPPSEMHTMFHEQVLPALPGSAAGKVLLTACVHAYGLPESTAAERLGPLGERGGMPQVGIAVHESTVTARVQAMGTRQEAEGVLEEYAERIVQRWRPFAYGRDDESLSFAVGRLLQEARRTLVTAESCSGGLLGKMIVDVAGSSSYYLGGWVTYGDALKTRCLGVPAETLSEHGAVSEPAARAMAAGGLARSAADYSLAITGIAGPGGGSPVKPVGTVYIALGRRAPEGAALSVRRFAFAGDRTTVRDRAAKSALQMLRFALLEVAPGPALSFEVPPRAE
jgi:nicotinamide-nucleotide amidase